MRWQQWSQCPRQPASCQARGRKMTHRSPVLLTFVVHRAGCRNRQDPFRRSRPVARTPGCRTAGHPRNPPIQHQRQFDWHAGTAGRSLVRVLTRRPARRPDRTKVSCPIVWSTGSMWPNRPLVDRATVVGFECPLVRIDLAQVRQGTAGLGSSRRSRPAHAAASPDRRLSERLPSGVRDRRDASAR